MARTPWLGAVAWVLAASLAGHPASAQMFVYAGKGQSAEQEERDKLDCHDWAVRQTGVNPDQPAQVFNPPATSRGFGVLGGSARGAGAGAVIGELAGDVARHSEIGAAIGGFRAILRRRRDVEHRYAEQQQEFQRHRAAVSQYDRAFTVCMTGRGYTVN